MYDFWQSAKEIFVDNLHFLFGVEFIFRMN